MSQSCSKIQSQISVSVMISLNCRISKISDRAWYKTFCKKKQINRLLKIACLMTNTQEKMNLRGPMQLICPIKQKLSINTMSGSAKKSQMLLCLEMRKPILQNSNANNLYLILVIKSQQMSSKYLDLWVKPLSVSNISTSSVISSKNMPMIKTTLK